MSYTGHMFKGRNRSTENLKKFQSSKATKWPMLAFLTLNPIFSALLKTKKRKEKKKKKKERNI